MYLYGAPADWGPLFGGVMIGGDVSGRDNHVLPCPKAPPAEDTAK